MEAAKVENPPKQEEEKIVIDMKAETESFTEEVKENLDTSTDKGYVYPPTTLLKDTRGSSGLVANDDSDTAEHLVRTLRSFGVETRIVDISRGPTVTRYELQPNEGVKISKITNLADDIALNLAVSTVLIAPVPGKAATVGVEIPNNIKGFGKMSLADCRQLKRVDLSTHTSIPTLGVSVFASCHADLQIKVPATLYEEWKNATNWADYADKIVTEFTNTL